MARMTMKQLQDAVDTARPARLVEYEGKPYFLLLERGEHGTRMLTDEDLAQLKELQERRKLAGRM